MDSVGRQLPHAHPVPHKVSTGGSPDSSSRDATSQPSRYAFLNHSTITVDQNLPPSVDDKPLARQRRRRTSPEDQTILEAAYNHDPKPDKAARLELVKRVSLGEKEVQIWFQNRRQTSRRKSRPLLPHEIAQYQMSRSGVVPRYFPSDVAASSSPEEDDCASREASDEVGPADEIREALSRELACGTNDSSSSRPGSSDQDPAIEGRTLAVTDSKASNATILPPHRRDQPPNLPGYGPHQQSHQPLRRSQSFTKPRSPPMHAVSVEPAPRLRKSSSMVRISLTGDGNAKVVTKDTASPSPPHASQGPPPSVQHSANQVHSCQHPSATQIPPMRPLHRSSIGRSRDSRVWEFWCDKDARSELEEKAEQDASGSAEGAIGLLRSASGRKVLGSIPSKRNAALLRQPIQSKRSKVDLAVPKLFKSSTALGRLEGMPDTKSKHGESPFSVYIPGNESDKENWSPSTAMSPDDQSEHSHHEKPGTASRDWARQLNIGANKMHRATFSHTVSDRPEDDPEVAASMRSAPKRSSVSGDEELDCVQGLLSLSQGNWR